MYINLTVQTGPTCVQFSLSRVRTTCGKLIFHLNYHFQISYIVVPTQVEKNAL